MDCEDNLIKKMVHSECINSPVHNPTKTNETSKLGVVVRSFLGEYVSENNVSDCALKLFMDKVQQLEAAWTEKESTVTTLQVQNEQLQMQLLNERNKGTIFQKRLQFIQENKGHFEKIKEVYLKMKQMEVEKCRSRMNIHKATQSESVMTMSSYATCAMQSETNEMYSPCDTSSTISVRKVELAKAQDTINVLKQLIFRREQMWGLNRDKQKHYVQNVRRLERENSSLRSIVRTQYGQSTEHIATSTEDIDRTLMISVGLDAIRPIESTSTATIINVTLMQGIIRKLEDRNSQLERLINRRSSDPMTNVFSEKEREVLSQIHDLEDLRSSTARLPYSRLPEIQDSKEPRCSSRKCPNKSVIPPVQRSRNRSTPSKPRIMGSVSEYSHPRVYERHRSLQASASVGIGTSRCIVRTEKVVRGGRTDSPLPQKVETTTSEESELEILMQIKDEIMKKQQNINKKLELFQNGLDKRQHKIRSRPSTPAFDY